MRTRLLRDFKHHPDQLLVNDTVFLMDELSRLRQLGFETRHKDDKYY